MNQNNFNMNNNNSQIVSYDYEDYDEDEGFLSRTGTFISSVFKTVVNTINPFKSQKYWQNPYDLNSTNDPIHNLNYIDNINDNNRYIGNPNNQSQIIPDINLNRNEQINLGNNNFDDSNQNFDFFTVEELINASPRLKDEIYKDIKKPIYIPNEEIFQKAKKYVYDNLVKKYKIMKPKIEAKIFGESVILLAIQLTNKYNIEKHYDALVNNRRNANYRIEINVPEIIKDYYSNKAKILFNEDLGENSQKISDNVHNELLNKFSQGIVNNESDQKNDNNYSINSERESRIVCRTPKTKRNYLTCLFENKYNYDYLCPNDRVKCQIYKECLIHKEKELQNYARVIEVTNNMFKFLCNENEKLRDIIKQKEEKIEEYTKEIILCRIKDSEYQKKMSNYQEEIENLKNNSQNNLQNLGSNNINSNLINNNNINFPKQNPLFKNDISFGNPNEKDNELTFKKPLEIHNENIFISRKKEDKDIFSSQKTPTFNNKDINNSSNNSNSNKNNNSSNFFLSLKSQSIDKHDSQKDSENRESEQKNNLIIFSFNQSEDKKDETENRNESEQNVEKIGENNLNHINSNEIINFGIGDKNCEKEIKEEKNQLIINNSIIDNDKNNKTSNIKDDNKNKNKIIFGFIPEEKNENEDQNVEQKKIIENDCKENKENNKNENKNEEINVKININNLEGKEIPKNEKKDDEFNKNKESLNNPSNPFLSVAKIKTNEEFSINSLNSEKDKKKNEINDRSTMDTTNSFIKFVDISNHENSNSFIIKGNNIFPEKKSNSQANPFVFESNNNQNKNPFIMDDVNNNKSNNPFLSSKNNDKTNNILNFNSSFNFNDKNLNNDNPFLQNKEPSQIKDSQTNNNFFAFNNNDKINDLSKSVNPFINQYNSETPNIFNINNNNNNEQKTNNNPFISNLSNAIINTNTSNNNINNISNVNSQSINPFISFGNNNNNNDVSSNLNNLNSNPFIQNSDSSNFQNFDKNNFGDKNNSSISGPLFNFRPNTQESNNVNPFLVNRNGFDLNSSNNSNNAFAMGVNKKKTQGNNYISLFDDNKSRKVNGFYN